MEPAGIDRRLSPNIIMDHILIQNLGLMAAALVTAVVLGQIIIPNILLVSFRKRLFDMPDPRKVHHNLVPRLGGVSFFPVVLFCVCLFIGLRILLGGTVESLFPPGTTPELLLFTAGLTLLYIVGVADDLIGVRYFKKFIVQLFAALMLPLSELYINNLYGLFGIYDLSPFLGIPLTLLLVVFITNAINLIDGIDGLASGLSMVALAVFGGLFIYYGWWVYALVAFVSIGMLIPFFSYNVFGNAARGRKIFMGDTGSLMLGYLLSLFTVKYCMYTGDTPTETIGSPVLVAFSVLLIPSLDVVRVVLRRVREGKNPFLPDKTHIHHKFLAMGFTPHMAMITILLMSACFCIFNLFAVHRLNNTLVFIIDITIWTVLNLWFDKEIHKKNKQTCRPDTT